MSSPRVHRNETTSGGHRELRSCLQQVRRGNLYSQGQAPDSGFVLNKEFVNVVVKSNPSAGE